MLHSLATKIEKSFTPAIVGAAALGLFVPQTFLWAKPYIPMLLGWVMFGIGLTVQMDQLKALVRKPSVSLFALGKFLVMPLLAYAAGRALQLDREELIGIVILGACPGGVSANVMSYLAGSNIPLTVLMTLLTTLLSPFLTPLIVFLFFHHSIAIDVWSMMQKLFWVVLFPVLDAIVLRRFVAKPIERVLWVFPPVSMLMIFVIIGFVTAANRGVLLAHPWLAIASVLIFNLGGYLLGYLIARFFRNRRDTCESVAFEYGMQDSSLGIIIATSFFSPLAALPCAICSVLQNLTGPWLAKLFARRKRGTRVAGS